jgi:16S rRNA (adenine1518-N6/adenine1519-N6)-dimethyltransferase
MPRRLGQHFLKGHHAERLLELVAPRATDTFLEIGPGHGALTLPLARRVARVVALELDVRLAQRLRDSQTGNLDVVVGDALDADWSALVPAGSRLVGNLPYYISSPLLRRALQQRAHFSDAYLMVQEEVAERVAAGPGSRDYGVLSVFFGLWTRTEIVLRLPPEAFSPPPKVRSAVLRVGFDVPAAAPVGSPEALERLVLKAFGQRRKTLENNLQDSYPNLKENLRLLHIAGSRRAETLSVVEFAQLAEALQADGGRVRADG